MPLYMKKLFNVIKSDRILKRGTILTLVLNIISALLSIIFYFRLPPIIPIFNQLPWGEERLGQNFMIFLPSALATAFFVINTIIAGLIYNKTPLIARILIITSLLGGTFVLLLTIRTIAIIS